MGADPEVVLVEDDDSLREAVERVLRGCGYCVAAFGSAEALQQQLGGAALWPGTRCLVCDVRLPGISGLELYRRLCGRKPVPRCIFITAHDDPGVRLQAEREGAAFLMKPFQGRALLTLVDNAVQSALRAHAGAPTGNAASPEANTGGVGATPTMTEPRLTLGGESS